MQSCLPHVGSLNPISLAQELVVLSPSAGQLCLMNTGLQTIIQSLLSVHTFIPCVASTWPHSRQVTNQGILICSIIAPFFAQAS